MSSLVLSESSPEKAGVAGSIPSLATIVFSITYRLSISPACNGVQRAFKACVLVKLYRHHHKGREGGHSEDARTCEFGGRADGENEPA
jgi:hypothetical protein